MDFDHETLRDKVRGIIYLTENLESARVGISQGDKA